MENRGRKVARFSNARRRNNAALAFSLSHQPDSRTRAGLGGESVRLKFEPNDHQTDALVTAAGMRALLTDPQAFSPPGLTSELSQTEGWTFGIV